MLVQDIGPRDAKIMLVGEAPGADEEKTGMPFQGGAGQLLRQILSNCGVDFNSCYITNVMNERPPGNDFAHFYEDAKRRVPKPRLEQAWKDVCAKIDAIKPSVCILLGQEALRAVTNKFGISNWRGCFQKYKDVCVLPTYHPAAVLRNFEFKPIVEMDIRKAISHTPQAWPYILIRPKLGDVLKFISDAQKADRIAFDIETIYKSVRSLAIAYKKDGQTLSISIPFIAISSGNTSLISNVIQLCSSTNTSSSYWSVDEEVIVLDALDRLFMSGIPVVGQNSISFDEPIVVENIALTIKNHYLDIMHAWHLVYSELPMGLDFLCSALTDYANYWTEKNTSVDDEEWVYNAQDAIVTLEVSYKIEQELIDHNLRSFYFNHIHPTCFAVQHMQSRGITVDLEARTKLAADVKLRMESTKAKLTEVVGSEVNPNSPKQMKELLYGKMKFPVARNKDDNETTNEEAIRKLSVMYPNEPVLKLIIDYRKDAKLLGTYLETPVSPDGRMRSSYNVSGTRGGRLSSGQNLWGEGANLQNIPAGRGQGIANIRHLYIASAGKEIMKGDLKQAETMVVAEILKRLGYPQLWLKYKEPAFDIHTWMASVIFNKAEADVVKKERNIGKVSNHSGNYMSGPNVLVKTALKWGIDDLSFTDAKRILSLRMKAMPGLSQWWEWVEKQVRTKRMLSHCLGRKRLFFGRVDNETLREAVSWEPQSIVGDVTNTILRKLDVSGTLPVGADVILQVHDEVVVEYKPELRDAVASAIQKASLIPLWINEDCPLIIPIELSYGSNWGKMIEYVESRNQV